MDAESSKARSLALVDGAGPAAAPRADPDFASGSPGGPDTRGKFVPSVQRRSTVRLVSCERYFGLPAPSFRAGAEKMLARISAQPPGEAQRVDLDDLGADFELGPTEGLALLRAMVADGLLVPESTGSYRPTARFVEYALAPMVAPLSRARAKSLIAAVRRTAEHVNAAWTQNPLEIRMVLVSGSYMSRSDRLPELALWLVLRTRATRSGGRWRPMVSKGTGLRQILSTVDALSSFIRVRIVAHRRVVPRPFCVVFEAADAVVVEESASRRLREWGAAIGELLSGGSSAAGRRGRGAPR